MQLHDEKCVLGEMYLQLFTFPYAAQGNVAPGSQITVNGQTDQPMDGRTDRHVESLRRD